MPTDSKILRHWRHVVDVLRYNVPNVSDTMRVSGANLKRIFQQRPKGL